MSYRGWCVAAALLLGVGPTTPVGAQEFFPIGAWFPGMIEGKTTRPTAEDLRVWGMRLDVVKAAGFNTVHAKRGRGQLRTPEYNQAWMALAHARGLKVQLHSWRQPEEWTESSRNYWTRTFSPIRSAGRSPTATGLCGMPRRRGSPCAAVRRPPFAAHDLLLRWGAVVGSGDARAG